MASSRQAEFSEIQLQNNQTKDLHLHVCMHICVWTNATTLVWRSENSWKESVLFFHYMGFRDQTHVGSLDSKCFYLMGHVTGPGVI